MPRDRIVKRSFEIADDGIQGVFGYYMYGVVAHRIAEKEKIRNALPEKSFPITHAWGRLYQPEILSEVMTQIFEPYHARVSLISMIGIFEGALQNFRNRIEETGHTLPKTNDNYKSRLAWAFNLVSNAPPQDRSMVTRLPEVFLDIDHARRMRNLWMHNNGLFTERYETDTIPVSGHSPVLLPDFQIFKKDKRRRIPLILGWDSFLGIYKSHVELLHEIHDAIQRTYFGQKRSYNYKTLKKPIEWHRLLLGV